MATKAMVMSAWEGIARRMNWEDDQRDLVIIMAVTVSSTFGLLAHQTQKNAETLQIPVVTSVGIVGGYLCLSRTSSAAKRWWAAKRLSFKRHEHGEVEVLEHGEGEVLDHGEGEVLELDETWSMERLSGEGSGSPPADESRVTRRSSSQ